MPYPYLAILRARVALRNGLHFAHLTHSTSCSQDSTPYEFEFKFDIYDFHGRRAFKPASASFSATIATSDHLWRTCSTSEPKIAPSYSTPSSAPPANRKGCVPEPFVELFDGPSRVTRYFTWRNIQHVQTPSFQEYVSHISSQKTPRPLIVLTITVGGARQYSGHWNLHNRVSELIHGVITSILKEML